MRVSPDGKILASYDVKKSRLRLTRLRPTRTTTLPLAKMTGAPLTFRWLKDGKRLVFATTHNVWVVKLNRDRTSVTKTKRLFKRTRTARISGVRAVEGGFILRTATFHVKQKDPSLAPSRVYFIPTNRWATKVDLVPSDAQVISATALSRGRVVVALRPKGRKTAEIWTLQLRGAKRPTVASRQACKTSHCGVTNWVPQAEKLAYAVTGGTIIWERAGSTSGSNNVHRFKMPFSRWQPVHSLWTNTTESRLLAANLKGLVIWDESGKVVTRFRPKKGSVRSAHFTRDGKGVLVATEREVLTLRDGKVVSRWLLRKGPQIASEVFLDDVKPLASGGIAYQVVRVNRRRIGGRRARRFRSRRHLNRPLAQVQKRK